MANHMPMTIFESLSVCLWRKDEWLRLHFQSMHIDYFAYTISHSFKNDKRTDHENDRQLAKSNVMNEYGMFSKPARIT